ncbi:L-proline dehydrogenase /delta-1-pyrroline-5-carboxylate dehydrogenase [Poseidonocella pacifica]|uniref:Bifunctional protein PutA n=1 Tax=Poseidonocella pacifica TaxID=871651 RepID=A0A1I0W934_9RHOB|nr:bifunctional proline dehydrogenase/L-glutamate gamma-semialdehyde dehydrogenase PutA [Poseidonocella pacifica]SFA85212.1 L-proline dehydrogenase /delta-1-pyrroline-5-carboxylate dehydrogenase [Poseidonocella pacifica]
MAFGPYEIDEMTYARETEVLNRLVVEADLAQTDREQISARAAELVRAIRNSGRPGMMESFLAEYGLSTEEGVALMCLAEALLRVPDSETIDALIEDKIAPSDWGKHMGHSASPLVNASTWALMLTGRVLKDEAPGIAGHLRGAVRRLGEPVIRTAVGRAMKEMGRQFVLGETIHSGMKRAEGMEAKGYTYSYDMLGEAARTDHDALRYHESYMKAIQAIATACSHDDIRQNPGISVKLSALHPRYELAKREDVLDVLVPRLSSLTRAAAAAGMGLNIDAEEAARLALSLEVIDAVLADPKLQGWDGFGVVVQAYGPRAGATIDFLYQLAQRLDRRLMVRLVKGAYWDTEIKKAQVKGIDGFPVFTSKATTDVSYIANARKLLGMTDRIYPQFATHNAHTVAAVLHMADDLDTFEFQRLHGMGETLHDIVVKREGTRCRIYAPVGAHKDLLAYLVRRLLENGANSSFVNQIVDENVPPETVAQDPFGSIAETTITTGNDLFQPERANSQGIDLDHEPSLRDILLRRDTFADTTWNAAPILAGDATPEASRPVENPFAPDKSPGDVSPASRSDVDVALSAATPWNATAADRACILAKAADLYEANTAEIFALLAREAGKTLPDAVAELREAVDFLRFYGANAPDQPPVGRFVCISPWNFPLAIFTGQIAAALAAGNTVLAKPAEQTPLIAAFAVRLLHEAGVPVSALQLLPGDGGIGAALTGDPRTNGVAFTGSTQTAKKIRSSMAETGTPDAPFIAETGGLNAMIVDSTALPEQAVQAIMESAFQSAGQRCSALRCLYVQEDIASSFMELLKGAMDTYRASDPWDAATDLGPVIDADARQSIADHIERAKEKGRVLHEGKAPLAGYFIAPTLISIDGIQYLEREIFGPVLHVATYRAGQIDHVIDAINATGYGLTFGLQTRIDDRVQHVTERLHAGNIYVNRNQIGAIVGSQPFGGEGLSGTGPKAGGSQYLQRFIRRPAEASAESWGNEMPVDELQEAIAEAQKTVAREHVEILPGPTGESNRYSRRPRLPLLCSGPGHDTTKAQAQAVRAAGGLPVCASGEISPQLLETLSGISGVIWWGQPEMARNYARSLARRDGPILPLITGVPDAGHATSERHVCVDTTAAGGNAALLGAAG